MAYKLHLWNRKPTSVSAHGNLDREWGTSTQKDLHVLCYQHHSEMGLLANGEAAGTQQYGCREPGCLIRYNSSAGYLFDTESAGSVEEEMTPRVFCSNDEQLMYLAEVRREIRSFRLWKCPQCEATRTSGDSSTGMEKKMGA
jgi:hypothetical protein